MLGRSRLRGSKGVLDNNAASALAWDVPFAWEAPNM